MVRFWEFFLDKKQFTIVLMVGLIAAGLYALAVIPKESAPEVEIPIGIVSVGLPGASAEDVEQLIINKLEDEIQTVENIDVLSSTAREGGGSVVAQFLASADLDKSIEDLKDAVDRAKPFLPDDATEPAITRINFADQPIFIISISTDLPLPEVARFTDEVKDELKSVSGVSRVDASGVQAREISVIVRKDALASYNLRIVDIVAAVRAANASLPVGSITSGRVEYSVKLEADIEDSFDLGAVFVGNRNGVPVYLRDVADIVDGVEEPSTFSRVSIDGDPSAQALTFYVFKKSGGDVTRIGDEVKQKLEDLKSDLLSNSSVLISFDSPDLVRKDIRELSQVGLETVILVMLSLFVTIGWRESVVAGLSIPLSFVIAFIGLYASGNTINFVSLFALILSVGILVDSGIVVTEAIHTRYKKFGDPIAAAKAALREYAWPLTAGTMTTIAVFVPLFFISGIVGKFVASIPFTIVFVLLASIFVALGIVPLIAVMFTKEKMNRLEKYQEEWNERARIWYQQFLRNLLENRKRQNKFLVGLGLLFVISLTLPVFGVVKVIFFPGEDQDFIWINMELPEGTPLRETDKVVRAVEETLYDDELVASFATTVGSTSSFDENVQSGGKYANIVVNLKEERDISSIDYVIDLRDRLSEVRGAIITVIEPSNGPPSGAPISIKLFGEEFENLEQAVDIVEGVLTETPGAQEVTTSSKDNGIQFVVTVDRERASEYGVSPGEIAQALRTVVTGSTATSIREGSTDIDIVVSADLNPNFRTAAERTYATVDDLRNLTLATPQGDVSLAEVTSISVGRNSAIIRHEDRERIATVSSYIAPGATALEIKAAFEERMADVRLPEDVTLSFGGENEDTDQSFRDMFLALIAGIILMLLILVLEFNSVRYSLYLLLTVPLSLIGVMAGLALTQQPLSFPSLIGVIALGGIIINHAIILMDSMQKIRARETGSAFIDIVIEASTSRLRPIFLTTITTVLGMIPLSQAAGLWAPLAFTIMFGLAFAMTLTLALIPVLFYRWPGKTVVRKENTDQRLMPLNDLLAK